MNKRIYKKMTKRRFLRGFKMFRLQYLNKHGLFKILAKLHLVREVMHTHSYPYISKNSDLGNIIVKDDIVTDRGVFKFSYMATGMIVESHWWYESLFRKKKLYVLSNERGYFIDLMAQVSCKEFLAKFDPFNHIVVREGTTQVALIHPTLAFDKVFDSPFSSSPSLSPKCISVNLLGTRLKLGIKSSMFYQQESIKDIINELVDKAVNHFTTYLEGNASLINERITGVSNDGEFTYEGEKLLPNCLCRKCGRPVFYSCLKDRYAGQCAFCDEDLTLIEIDKVDPKKYEKVYEYNKLSMYKLLNEL